jgi:hypothetical protein
VLSSVTARMEWPLHRRQPPVVQQCVILLRAKNKRDDEEEGDEQAKPGMNEAFRMLDELTSLDDDAQAPPPGAAAARKNIEAADEILAPLEYVAATAEIPLEKEIETYKDMVNELEKNQDAAVYEELYTDLGGSGETKATDDTYSQVLTDLGGTKQQQQLEENETSSSEPQAGAAASSTNKLKSAQDFMDDALQEALKEVKVNNPKIRKESILDDREIMKEIEAIFERGNQKLMESLEEIRKEQVRQFGSMCIFFVLLFLVILYPGIIYV